MRIRHAKRDGGVTIEFALVASIFLLFVMAMIEFSRINIIRHAADNAAYEAARVGIVPGSTVPDVTAIAANHLDIVGVTGAAINVTPDPLVDESESVTVAVSVPVAPNSWMIPQYFAGNIQGSSTLSTERYRDIPD